jgi:hypothetical protein
LRTCCALMGSTLAHPDISRLYPARMSERVLTYFHVIRVGHVLLPSLVVSSRMSVTIRKGLAQQVHLNSARRSKHVRSAFASLRSRDGKSFVQARPRSTTSAPHNEPPVATSWLLRGSSIRVSTLFTALLALGAGATALGLCVGCHK